MQKLIIKDGNLVNNNTIYTASIVIVDGKIIDILTSVNLSNYPDFEIFNAKNLYVLPGIIDTHVHFREPGLTAKADIYTESCAAAAGGVTSFFDMPNTKPQTISVEKIKQKFDIASQKSVINYSFFIGATTDNEHELAQVDENEVAGIKLFFASSTGNMLVNDLKVVEKIFKNAKIPIVIHSEEQSVIDENISEIKTKSTKILPEQHEFIRSEKACFEATKKLVNLAEKHQTKIHFLHISTASEIELFASADVAKKSITAEVSPNHLYFDSSDYSTLKMQIKCNPSIKEKKHKTALLQGLINNKIDTIATDHAPHIFADKLKEYEHAPSGIPSIQHSLNIMLEFVHQNKISIEKVVEKMCHNPARIFNISKRGFIEKDFWADLVLVDLQQVTEIEKENILYKCAWSPLEGRKFNSKIIATIVNGNFVYKNGKIFDDKKGMKIKFDR